MRETYCDTFDAFITGIAENFSDLPAVTWFTRKQEEKNKTFRELTRDVTALRNVLCARGFAGSHIAIVGKTTTAGS